MDNHTPAASLKLRFSQPTEHTKAVAIVSSR